MTSQVSFGKIVSKDENNELHVYTAGLAPPPLNLRDSTAECRNGGLDPVYGRILHPSLLYKPPFASWKLPSMADSRFLFGLQAII